MENKINLILILLVCFAIHVSEVNAETEFLHARFDWNISIKKLKETAGDELVTYRNLALIEKTKISGLNADVWYMFKNERLAEILIEFRTYHGFGSGINYIADYEKVTRKISGLYGKPKQHRQIWKDKSLKNIPYMYGSALESGDLSIETKWITEDTIVIQQLKRLDPSTIKHQITFRPRKK